MNRGIELRIQGAGAGGTFIFVERAPFPFVDEMEPIDVGDLPAAGASPVAACGGELFQRLSANPHVAAALGQLKALGVAQVNPVYLSISDDRARALPWETLAVDDEFLALQKPWPIARITRGRSGHLVDRPYPAPSDFRVLAVLAALGQPAADEWEALHRAAAEARAAGLDVRVRVLTSEVGVPDPLFATVQAVAAAEGWVEVVELQSTPAALADAVGAFEPHVLHFFCHGSVRGPTRRLDLATINDWNAAALDQAPPHGSLVLGVADVARIAVAHDAWLVVVNACEGGRDTPEVQSFAAELVQLGVPAAIAHRKVIHRLDAHRFCGALYRDVFELVGGALAAGGVVEIDWAQGLHRARSDLSQFNQPPEDNDQWSLPVLHVRPDPFQVEVAAAGDRATVSRDRGVAATVEGLVDILEGLDLPPGLVDDLRAGVPQ